MTKVGTLILPVTVEFEIDTANTEYDYTDDKFYEDPIIDALYHLDSQLKNLKVSYDCKDARLRIGGFEIEFQEMDSAEEETVYLADRPEAGRILGE